MKQYAASNKNHPFTEKIFKAFESKPNTLIDDNPLNKIFVEIND